MILGRLGHPLSHISPVSETFQLPTTLGPILMGLLQGLHYEGVFVLRTMSSLTMSSESFKASFHLMWVDMGFTEC